MTNSNENLDMFPSAASFLPLPTPSSTRSTLSNIENLPSAMMDNDLQRVPHSWMLMSPTSSSTSPPIVQPPARPSAQVVQSTGRPHSMPSWRGYLPMKFEPVSMDQYPLTSHFSQKVFLGGIPAELTEGESNSNDRRNLTNGCVSAELLLVLRKFGKCNIKWPKSDGVSQNMPGQSSLRHAEGEKPFFTRRVLPCGFPRISFGVRTSQTLYSPATFNDRLLSQHSHDYSITVDRFAHSNQPVETSKISSLLDCRSTIDLDPSRTVECQR